MNSKDLTKNLEMLEPADHIKYLIKLLFNLTVVARNTYVIGEDEVERPKALRGIVEISHKTTSRIMAISNGWFIVPVRDYSASIFAVADIYGCLFELENAIAFSD